MVQHQHIPVLQKEVLALLQEKPAPLNCFLDGTFGRGGHTRLVLDHFPQLRVIGMDQDAAAIEFGRGEFRSELEQGRLLLLHGNFKDVAQYKPQMDQWTGQTGFDAILLDLGVSSPQLDSPERGFSFYHAGPLDMRMDQRQELTAADIVNTWEEEDLIQLFQSRGEIRRPYRVVSAIVKDRKTQGFDSTQQLSEMIARVEGWHRKGHHPATRYFLALRLQVNQELENIEMILPQLIDQLNDKGRLLVITFHSLEDRIVKQGLKAEKERGFLVHKKVIQAQWEEKKKNPRSRSAKLRVFQRGHNGEKI